MTRRIAAAVLILCALTAPACGRGGDADGTDVPFIQVDPDSGSATDRAIAEAQATLRDDPDDSAAQLALAQAFLQKVRETGDPSLYTKAETLLDLVAAKVPDDVRVLVAQGVLALARHEFTDALRLGRRALEVAPGNGAAFGVVVDASNELGRYDEAEEATQQMVDVRPDLASLSRVSYARELRGDLEGAITAMTQAVTAAGATDGENVAYTQVQLGHLLLTRGDLDQAIRAYEAAERAFPDFAPAQAGRARVLVAQERYGEAADLLGEVVDVLPLAEYAIAYGQALDAAGRDDQATEAYGLVGAIAELYEANGVDVDLELAVFDADRSPGGDALARARRALDARPGIFGHDAVAWNLFRAGDTEKAILELDAALATGSEDPQLRYHAAEISAAEGDTAAATEHLEIVLGSNPRFSAVYTADVARLARELGLTMPPAPTA